MVTNNSERSNKMVNRNISRIGVSLIILSLLTLTGCATLTVTETQTIKPSASKLPYKIGVQTSGDRIRSLLNSSDGSLIAAASGTLFDKVILLPGKARFQQPSEIHTTYGVDYILEAQIADLQANGSLNPIFFPSILLVFFKPLTPMVTYESSVALNASLVDARTGEILMQKEVVETATDHFSPVDPKDKVKKLIAVSINNALVKVFSDLPGIIAAKKKP
jgi:carbamoylphosphate synthase large subunit